MKFQKFKNNLTLIQVAKMYQKKIYMNSLNTKITKISHFLLIFLFFLLGFLIVLMIPRWNHDWVRTMALSFLSTFLLLMIVFILIVGSKNLSTKKAIFESLKKKKSLNWFFLLDKRIQMLIVIMSIGIIWCSLYIIFSSNLFFKIWCKVLHSLSIKAFCTDDGISKNPASSKQSGRKNKEENTGKSANAGNKSSPSSSSSSQAKGKQKASSSSKKNKTSKKEKMKDATEQTQQVSKAEASKAAKESKPSSSSGRLAREEDLWGDGAKDSKPSTSSGRPVRAEDLRDDYDYNSRLAMQLKNAKMLSEKGKEVKEDTVDYFPEFENAKGSSSSKSQVTEIERGESNQAKEDIDFRIPESKHKHIRHMEGETAFELGSIFGKIKKDSYIFRDDNKTNLKPNESE